MWASSYYEWPYLQEFGGIWLNSPRILPTSTHGLSSVPMCQDWSHGGSESYMNLGTLSLVFAFECIWKTWPTVRHKKWHTIDMRQEKITCSSWVESYFRPQNEKLHEEPPGILKKHHSVDDSVLCFFSKNRRFTTTSPKTDRQKSSDIGRSVLWVQKWEPQNFATELSQIIGPIGHDFLIVLDVYLQEPWKEVVLDNIFLSLSLAMLRCYMTSRSFQVITRYDTEVKDLAKNYSGLVKH